MKKAAMVKGSGVRVRNLNTRYPLNETFTKKVISDVLKYIRAPKDAEWEFIFLDDKSIRDLNKKYRGKDRPTDVLSFKLDKSEFGSKGFLGEAFISLDRAFENSAIFETEFADEVALYIIHAILHIVGYDDEKAEDKLRMSRKEKGVLKFLCTKEALSKVLMRR